ncbi:MAG TPA: MBL fold metallo-hydrolase [Patescibacteria group bacterium]|nr:MBL fold metallo-hydrolase [Patescibacteria group bacterium]
MKVTKYAHACVVLEDQGKKVVIDPGEFANDFGGVDNIAAVVVTHMHGDHFSPEHLQAIVGANPDVVVYTVPEVAEQWGDPHAKVVHAYEDHTTGPFTFRFVGELHALIHSSVPQPQNIGVYINNGFYYPGDSFVLADRDVSVLAVPACAPWLKIGEAMDFLTASKPARCFPTHDIMLSDTGHDFTNSWLSMAAKTAGTNYTPLKPGESFDY